MSQPPSSHRIVFLTATQIDGASIAHEIGEKVREYIREYMNLHPDETFDSPVHLLLYAILLDLHKSLTKSLNPFAIQAINYGIADSRADATPFKKMGK